MLTSSFSYKFFAETIPERGLRLLTKYKIGYDLSLLQKVKTGESRPARRHTFARQQKYAKVPSPGGGHILSPAFRGFNKYQVDESGPLHSGGLSVDAFYVRLILTTSSYACSSEVEDLKGLVIYGGSVERSALK